MHDLKKNFNNRVKRDFLIPECKEMCPDDEFNLRTKNNLVHVLEKKIVNSKVEYNLIKEYSRPAAGKIVKSKELRTIETLLKTVEYLVQQVYPRSDVDFVTKYEFLFDRFRAIRQDLIIQRSKDENSFKILQIILNFYIISDYKLCTSKNYDEFMNAQHLNEVLHSIVSDDNNCDNKSLYYSIFVLLNLSSNRALTNILKVSKNIKSTYPLDKTVELCKAFCQENFVKIFRLYKELPLVCQLVFHRRIPSLESKMVKVMNHGFSFKNSRYPIENFLDITLLNGRGSLKKYTETNSITIADSDYIAFSKMNSNAIVKEIREHFDFIDEKLENLLESEFILDSSWL